MKWGLRQGLDLGAGALGGGKERSFDSLCSGQKLFWIPPALVHTHTSEQNSEQLWLHCWGAARGAGHALDLSRRSCEG